ncbi:hypothetical protein ABLE91_11805 [Aquabacter sp. CN5-332]|uniref:hypothetical protein n=1 Tax=Aquabacter sp. CN5-332 TaxID=3156608 RepID=UPI0032B5B82F
MPGGPYASIDAVKSAFLATPLTFTDATNQLIALAASGDLDFQIQAGLGIAYLVENNPRVGGSGGSFQAATQLVSILATAFPFGATPPTYAYGLLAGILAGPSSVILSDTEAKLGSLVGHDAAEANLAIEALAAAFVVADANHRYEPAAEIAKLLTSVPLGVADLATALDGLVHSDNLAVLDAIALLGRVGILYGAPLGSVAFANAASAVAAGVIALVQADEIDSAAAIDALVASAQSLASLASGGGGAGALQYLVAIAGAEPSLFNVAGAQLAGLVNGSSSAPSTSVGAQTAVTAVTSGLAAGQFTASEAVSLLAGIASAAGTPSQPSQDPLQRAGTAIRGLVENGTLTAAQAAAAIQDAITGFGLTHDAGVTVLLGIGANGNYQLLNNTFQYVGNDALIAAAAAALADLFDASPSMSSASIAADLARAFLADSSALTLKVLVQAALASGDADVHAKIGAALAQSAAAGIRDVENQALTVATALAAIGAQVVANAGHGGAEAIAVVIGFAGATTGDANEVLAGRQIARIIGSDASLVPADSVAEVLEAVATQALTSAQATVLWAGVATAPNAAGQIAAWNAIASLLSADLANLAVLDGAIGGPGSPLGFDEAFTLLVNIQALATAPVASAILAEAISLAARSPDADHVAAILFAAVETAGQALFGVQKEAVQAGVALAAATQIAAFVTEGLLTAESAVADVAIAVGNGTLSPLRAVAALANLQAAGLDGNLIEDALQDLIDGGAISARQVVLALIDLQVPGASAALQAALAGELDTILTTPANFAATAGLGSAAQVLHVSDLIAALFATDVAAAQAVLDALPARIAAGNDITAEQASQFLLDLYGEGEDAGVAALASIVSLASTIPPGHIAPYITIFIISNQLGSTIAAGEITAAAAVTLLEALLPVEPGSVRTLFATLIVDAHLTVAALDAEVALGNIAPLDAIEILGSVISRADGTVRADALTEVAALAGTDAGLGQAALAIFVALAGSTNPSNRETGYAGIDALAVVPGLGKAAFEALLPFLNASNILVAADTQTELVSLLADGRLTTDEAITALRTQLITGSPVITHEQVLDTLVALSHISASQASIYANLEAIAVNGTGGVTLTDVILALANDLSARMGESSSAAVAIIDIANGGLSPSDLAGIIVQAFMLSAAEKAALLAQIGGLTGQALAYGLEIASRAMPLSGLGEVMGSGLNQLSPQNAVEIVLGSYANVSRPFAIAELDALMAAGKLSAADVAFAIIHLATSAQWPTAEAIDTLVGIAYGSASPAIVAAAAEAIADAITGGSASSVGALVAADILTGLNDAVASQHATPMQALALIEKAYLFRLAQVDSHDLTGAAFEAATATLLATVNDELTYLTSHGLSLDEVVTALAQASADAAPAQLAAIGAQIVALASATLLPADIVADIMAATAGSTGITDAQAAAILVSTAIAGGNAVQLEAGRAIGGLYTDGSFSATQVVAAIDGPTYGGTVSPAQALALTLGVVSVGGAAAVGLIMSHLSTLLTTPVLASGMSDAVLDHTITAVQAIDAAAAASISFGNVATTIAIAEALVASGGMTPAEAVAALGPSAGDGFFSVSAALQVVMALAAGETTAHETDIGLALGEWLAAGWVTEAQLSAGLLLGINGDLSGHAPVITIGEAIQVLLGLASAANAGVSEIGDRLLASFIEAEQVAGAIATIDASVVAGTLTGAEALDQLLTLAAGFGPTANVAVAAELVSLVSNGHLGITTGNGFFLIQSALQMAVASEALDSGRAVFIGALALQSPADFVNPGALVYALIDSGAITPAAATAQLVAATEAAPQTVPATTIAALLAQFANNSSTSGQIPALVAASVASLATLMETGSLSPSFFAAPSPDAKLLIEILDVVDARLASAPSSALHALQDSLYAALLTLPDATVVAGVETAMAGGLVTVAHGLGILIELTSRGGSSLDAAVAAELASLIQGSSATTAQVANAFSAAEDGIVLLAGMIDPAVPVSELTAVLARLLSDTLTSGATAGAAASDIAGAVGGAGPALTAAQAVFALSSFGQVGQTDVTHAGAVAIAGLVAAGKITEDDALAGAEHVLLAAPTGAAQLGEAALIAAFLGALGHDAAGIVEAIVDSAGVAISRVDAVHVLALLTATQNPGLGDPSAPVVTDAAIAQGLIDVAIGFPSLTLDQALATFASVPLASVNDTLDILFAVATVGAIGAQVSAGHAAALSGVVSSTVLAGLVDDLTLAQQTNFVLGLSSGAQAFAADIAVRLDFQAPAQNLAANVITALQQGVVAQQAALAFLVGFANATLPGSAASPAGSSDYANLAFLIARVAVNEAGLQGAAVDAIAGMVDRGLITSAQIFAGIDTGIVQQTLTVPQAAFLLLNAIPVVPSTDIAIATKLISLLQVADLFEAIDAAVTSGAVVPAEGMRLSAILAALNSAYTADAAAAMVALLVPNEPPATTVMQAIDAVKDLGTAAVPDTTTAIASLIRALIATGAVDAGQAVAQVLASGTTLPESETAQLLIKLGVSADLALSAAAAAAYMNYLDDGSALADAVAAGLIHGTQAGIFAATVLANHDPQSDPFFFQITMSLGEQLASLVRPGLSITDILTAITSAGTPETNLQLFAAIVVAVPSNDPAVLGATRDLITAGTITIDEALAAWGQLLHEGNLPAVGRLVIELAAGPVSDSLVLEVVSHIDEGRIARDAILSDLQAARAAGGNPAQLEAMAFAIAGAVDLSPGAAFQPGAAFSYRGLGHFLAAPLAALTDATAAAAAMAEFIAVADAALVAGRLSASRLASLLTSFATEDGPGPYAVLAAATELSALLDSGRLTTAELVSVMTGFAQGSGDPAGKLVHLLVEMSEPALESSVEAVSALVNGGYITAVAAASAVHELSGTTPAGVAAGLALAPEVAEEFLLRLTLHGNGPIQDAAFAQVVADIASGSPAVGDGITGAIQSGWMAALDALHVTARLLVAETSDPAGVFGTWAASHVPALVSDAGLTAPEGAAIFLRALTTAGSTGHGEILDILLGLPGGLDTIHDAFVADPTLAAATIDALLSIADNSRFGAQTTAAALAEVLEIFHEGRLSAAQLAAHAIASGHFEILRVAVLTDAPDEATKVAFTADYVAHFRTMGDHLLADTWLSASDAQVGYDYFRVTHGLMTIAEAAADLITFTTGSGASVDEALLNLSRLFGPTDAVSANQIKAFVFARIESGDLQFDLAHHMQTAGNALTMNEAITRFFPTGIANYQHDPDTYTDQFAAEAYLLAQINAGQALSVSGFHPFATITVAPGVQYLLPGPANRSSFGLELALGALIESPTTSPSAKAEAQAAIGQLLLYGKAAADVVDYVTDRSQPNHLTVDLDLALSLLDAQADLARTASSDSDPELERQIALAWLFVNDRAGVGRLNSQNSGHVESNLRGQLLSAAYVDDVVAGLGALISLPSSVYARDQLAAATEDYMKNGYLPAHAGDIQNDIDTILGGGSPSVQQNLYGLLDTGFSKTQGMQNFLGVIHDDIVTDPTSVEGYARLGAALAGGSLASELGRNLLGVSGSTLTVAGIGSKLALYALSQSVVSNFLGEGLTDTLRGAFTIAGATAGLISSIVFESSQEAVDNGKTAVPHLLDFGNAVKNGDTAGILSASGHLVSDYYKITTGFDLNVAGNLATSLGFFLGDLATGDVDALHHDITRLGDDFVELFRSNVYVGIIGESLITYSATINSALYTLGSGLELTLDGIVSGVAYLSERAEDVGDWIVSNIFGIDGYIEGATVFADRNLNGVQDPGEASAAVSPTGGYTLVNPVGRITLRGGIDTATGLAFTGTLTAPASSSVLTPLTTLISKLATPGDANPTTAETTISTALGLASDIDLMTFNPVSETLAGDFDARKVLAAGSMVLNTITLLQAAGAADAVSFMAEKMSSGALFDLTNATTVQNLAIEAGVGAAASAAVAALATASNTLVTQAASSQSDAASFLRTVFAISIDTQGAAADAIRAAGSDAGALNAAIAAHTGSALDQAVADNVPEVGSLYPSRHVVDGVSLKAALDGHGIELMFDADHAVPGHWVRFEAQGSSLPGGATLLVYAVDAAGNLVSRADHHVGTDVTLDAATLATIGAVSDDHGNDILLGGQSVYLNAGEQLRFALLSGNHAVDLSPPIEILAKADGSLHLDVAGLQVSAITNSSLSDSAELAGFQRDSGEPLLFLHQGDTLNVELAGSSANTNTLSFVHIDVDGATGAWSVGGVAYGDTDAFHHAVAAQLDAGFSAAHGGASFNEDATWTVAGTTGYYAPVLMTPSGQVFVVGNGNTGGFEYVRMFGENTFGFEDLAYDQGSDFDYNDMVMRLTPVPGHFVDAVV